MNIFDIVGPVMVGPSSSHTAGAVKIGYVSRKLLGENIREVHILLYGSFLATGRGHGTDRAIVAGLLGMLPDDDRVPYSMEEAEKQNMKVTFGEAVLKEAHPNTAVLQMKGESGRELEVVAASLGGGRIKICMIDGLDANFTAEHPTLIVHNQDQPGHVAEVKAETIMMAPAAGFYTTPGSGVNQVRLAYVLCKEDIQRALFLLEKAIEQYNSLQK